jgi:hypothetical protein
MNKYKERCKKSRKQEISARGGFAYGEKKSIVFIYGTKINMISTKYYSTF